MPYIFLVNETNRHICVQHRLFGVPATDRARSQSAAWSRVTNCSYTFTEQGCCTGHLEQNLTHFWRNTRSKVRGTFRPLTRSTATIPTDCMLAPTNFEVTVFPSRKSND